MTTFIAKVYQTQVLESISAYLQACRSQSSAAVAFAAVTEQLWQRAQSYQPIDGFEKGMPYFCLRIPTGGGKTWLAAKSVALVNAHLLQNDYSVILWLVPSKAIREQTLRALKNREHPYYAALQDAGAVTVTVMDLSEAKSLTRATLDTSTVIIVSTVQAFRREDTEGLKVYESSGALMHHFDGLSVVQKDSLLKEGEAGSQTVPYSLANVLRMRRPFVVVDEAHNNRTALSFDTLAKFNPSGIMELTATPDTTLNPSNVLHSVSAAELKGEEMIKLPIVLQTEPNWQQCLADAITRRNELQALANADARKGASYLRPLVLIQAEPRRAGVETLDVDNVRQELIANHNIPLEEIIMATGEERGLEDIDARFAKGISDEKCPVKFIITQKALAEGWDCPFAYILVSMAALHSSTAVEQLLGRVLRQPEAKHRDNAALNQSYAFVASRDFAATASALRDRLVEGAGFERKAVAEFVTAANPAQGRLDYSAKERIVITPVSVALAETPNMQDLPKALKHKVTWNALEQSLTIVEPLSLDEEIAVQATVNTETAKQAITQAVKASRQAVEFFQTPAELGVRFAVPQMMLNVQGDLMLFDDAEVLNYEWELSPYDAAPTPEHLKLLDALLKVSEGGEIDIDGGSGKVTMRFIADLQRDLGLAYAPEHWTEVKLAAWFCRNILEDKITHDAKQMFVAKWLQELLLRGSYDLAKANNQKFLIRNLLSQRIKDLRLEAVNKAYQHTLFDDGYQNRVQISNAHQFVFHTQAYAPSSDYDDRFGPFQFRKHYYGRIGDFDSKEEFECAVWLDMQAQKGNIDFWVRNLVRKETCSFYLQKADGRFYPDFVCQLKNGKVLVVEYKGGNAWTDAKDDRLIGGLWAEMSGGNCQFIMVKDKQWQEIASAIP